MSNNSTPQAGDFAGILRAQIAQIVEDTMKQGGGDQAKAVKQVEQAMQKQIDAVNKRIAEVAQARQEEQEEAQPLKVKIVKGGTPKDEVAHKQVPYLLFLLANKQVPALVGPAGSGKTTACEQVARMLKLPFGMVSLSAQTTETKVFGYTNLKDLWVDTVGLREAFTKGGIFLFDEVDAGNPNILTAINSMIANRMYTFQGEVVRAHKNFRAVFAMNTYGTGGDPVYVGRNRLDGATIDRLSFVPWDYDVALEKAVVPDQEMLAHWHCLRKAAEGTKLIVSTRSAVQASYARAYGQSKDFVYDNCLRKGGVDEATFQRILTDAKNTQGFAPYPTGKGNLKTDTITV